MNADPDLGLPPCQCCREAPAMCGDPHVGDVCPDCYLHLTFVRIFMEGIGQLAGIGPCSSHIIRHSPK